MDQLTDYSDERNRGFCIHCGESLAHVESDRDHAPTKALLNRRYPMNLPVVQVCRRCNCGFAADEEYFAALIGAVLSGSTEPHQNRVPTAARILAHSPRLRESIDRAQHVQGTLWGSPQVRWEAELERVSRVVLKNARGHVFYELGELVLWSPSYVGFSPIPVLSAEHWAQFNEVPSGLNWPEVGSRSMQRMAIGEGQFGGWVEVQRDVYRYAVMQTPEQILVRTVIRDYLATEVSWDESGRLTPAENLPC